MTQILVIRKSEELERHESYLLRIEIDSVEYMIACGINQDSFSKN